LKKILIIRFSSIGDIVLTTPVVRCLKKQLGGEIHYLTKKQNQTLLSENPFITKIWLYDHNFRELIPLLQAEKFDFIVDLHKNLRSLYVRLKLRKPYGTFSKLNLEKWRIVNLKNDVLPRIHIVDRYFMAVRSLGVINDKMGLDYFIPVTEEVEISALPEAFRQGFIAFVIGGKHITKIFPEEKVVQVCKEIHRPVALLGGKEDADRGTRIESLSGELVYNACGKFSVNQSASLIRQSDIVITNDTGLMHIAAAFGKQILSIWGNTIPEFGMYPYMEGKVHGSSEIFEIKGLSCRPCSKIGFDKCPKGHFRCMFDQEVGKIIESVKS
jgi:ADP-heptose:LPS heptosyltransferase